MTYTCCTNICSSNSNLADNNRVSLEILTMTWKGAMAAWWRAKAGGSRVGQVLLYVHKNWGLLGTGAQDGYVDFHTAPELWFKSYTRQTLWLIKTVALWCLWCPIPAALTFAGNGSNLADNNQVLLNILTIMWEVMMDGGEKQRQEIQELHKANFMIDRNSSTLRDVPMHVEQIMSNETPYNKRLTSRLVRR